MFLSPLTRCWCRWWWLSCGLWEWQCPFLSPQLYHPWPEVEGGFPLWLFHDMDSARPIQQHPCGLGPGPWPLYGTSVCVNLIQAHPLWKKACSSMLGRYVNSGQQREQSCWGTYPLAKGDCCKPSTKQAAPCCSDLLLAHTKSL